MPSRVDLEKREREPLGDRHSNHGDYSDEDENAGYSQSQSQYQPRKSAPSYRKKHRRISRDSGRSSRDSDDQSTSSSDSLNENFRHSKENRRKDRNSEYVTMGSTKKARAATRAAKKAAAAAAASGHESEEEVQMTAEQRKIAELESKILVQEALQKIPAKPKSSKTQSSEERIWGTQVKEQVKKHIWHSTKFCYSDDKLLSITGKIFDKWHLKEFEGLTGKALKHARAEWVAVNQEWVRHALNDVRNYSQSQLRTLITTMIKEGKPVPTPDEVIKIALRDKEFCSDPKNHWKIDFYHDVLLFKVCGKELWDTNLRHKVIMSAPLPEDPEKTCISVNTEAYLCALYENCIDKWALIIEEQEKKAKGEMTEEQIRKRKDPRHVTKYIDNKAGVARWGGWNKAGRNRVKQLYEQIEEAHFTKETNKLKQAVKKIEEDCLKRIRTANDCDKREAKAGKKRKQPSKASVVDEDSDDEFDRV